MLIIMEGCRIHRLWEVDAVRGIAIIMMLLSNLLFDFFLFGSCTDCYSGFWFFFARATATLFLLLVGVSLTLSINRSERAYFMKYLKRGIRIFSWGLLITAITLFLVPQGPVFFGILHLIGVSVIISYPLLRKRLLNLFLGIAIILIGFSLMGETGPPWLLWFISPGTFSVDYTPIFPWFGVILIGVFMGNAIFPQGKSRFPLPDCSRSPPAQFLALLGRKSLFIYFIHQPVFLAILLLAGFSIL
jgi:uncharacterized membrane protein